MSGGKLLILDDSQLDLRQWGRMLSELGYDVVTKQAGDDFTDKDGLIALLRAEQPTYLLTDYDMQGFTAFTVLAAVNAVNPKLPVVMHSTNLPGIARFTGKSIEALVKEGFFLAIVEKGDVKGIDAALKNHVH